MANLAISDLRTDFPEGVAYSLDGDAQLVVCKFNDSRTFNLVAVGCYDGSIRIADLDCKAFARDLPEHVAPVSSLRWFYLAPTDTHQHLPTKINAAGRAPVDPTSPLSLKDCVLRFGSPVVMAAMHTVVDPVLDANGDAMNIDSVENADNSSAVTADKEFCLIPSTKSTEFIQTTVVSFDSTGMYVFLGNAKGIVTVVEEVTRSVLMHFRPSGTSSIKGFHFSSDGKYVAVNSADKTLRCYYLTTILGLDRTVTEIQPVEPDFKYFDSIDQNRWVQCVYSPDAKYFIGGSAVKNSHKIYIWETKTCTLTKLLEIQKDSLVDIAWHPKLPILVSISTAGVLNVWTVKVHENWSAFAPDFRELDENVEYIELEDEFDVVEDSQKRSIAISKAAEEDEYVDVLG
ncbi:UNVERIFIED_CONTAM: Retinoblastoma-binding protein 5 [Siphonaria sp. JEL0065]|nr:Retinoblastoma-binding protein 5 [Siphonaria sp. JEL0065]